MQKKIVEDFFNLTEIDGNSYELSFRQGQNWNASVQLPK
jgi:hypothetical protein